MHEWLRSQPNNFISRSIHALPKRWKTCMKGNGDYIEKWSHCAPFVFNKLRYKNISIFKVLIWLSLVYRVQSTQQQNKITIMFTATCFDSKESSSGYVRTTCVLQGNWAFWVPWDLRMPSYLVNIYGSNIAWRWLLWVKTIRCKHNCYFVLLWCWLNPI